MIGNSLRHTSLSDVKLPNALKVYPAPVFCGAIKKKSKKILWLSILPKMETLLPSEVLAFRLIKIMYLYFFGGPRILRSCNSTHVVEIYLVFLSAFSQFAFGQIAAVFICFLGHVRTLSGLEVRPVPIALWVIAFVSYWTFCFVL